MIARSPGSPVYVELFKKVSNLSSSQEYRNRQAIFSQGDSADAMFYVKTGHVKLTVASKNGKKAVIAILRPGDFFGECCLANKSNRGSTATAIQPSVIHSIKRSSLVRLIQKEPSFAKLFITYLLQRIGSVEDEFVDQIFNSSEKRLARVLLMLAGFGKHSKPGPALLKVTQETLAEMVGTTRSRVSYFMNRFRELGLIEYNGTIKVNRELRTFLLKD